MNSVPMLSAEFYNSASPIFILALGAFVAMLQAVIPRLKGEPAVSSVLYLSLIASLGASIADGFSGDGIYMEGAYLKEGLAYFGHVLVLSLAFVITLLFRSSYLRPKFFRGEISSLFLMTTLGMMVMVSSEDLITLFVGLELSSIGLYALTGYIAPNRFSQEGAIKYFILGSFAAAILLFGFGLLYAGSGSLRLSEIITAVSRSTLTQPLIVFGTLFTLVGIGFKLALAPFHLWAPDVYESAPTPLTAFMATGIKIMMLIVSMRILVEGGGSVESLWLSGLTFLAVVSMLLGNVMALVQQSLKRMLAYSSIAHSGYIAIALAAMVSVGGLLPMNAILFYLIGYTIITVGAFAIITWLENEDLTNITVVDIRGLAANHPWAAFALTVFMLSFAGMPPTVGFIAKLFVFNAAIQHKLYAIVLIGVVGSAISLYYYLRVIVAMYMHEDSVSAHVINPRPSRLLSSVVGAALLAVILMGTVLPAPILRSLKLAMTELGHIP